MTSRITLLRVVVGIYILFLNGAAASASAADDNQKQKQKKVGQMMFGKDWGPFDVKMDLDFHARELAALIGNATTGNPMGMDVNVSFADKNLPVSVGFQRNSSIRVEPIRFGDMRVSTSPIELDYGKLPHIIIQIGVVLVCFIVAIFSCKWLFGAFDDLLVCAGKRRACHVRGRAGDMSRYCELDTLRTTRSEEDVVSSSHNGGATEKRLLFFLILRIFIPAVFFVASIVGMIKSASIAKI